MSTARERTAVRLALGLASGVLAQLVALYLILHWVERSGDGVASRSLIAIAVMAVAIPVTGMLNARLILTRAQRGFASSLLASTALALAVPCLLAALMLAI